jgi:hypothetical protein
MAAIELFADVQTVPPSEAEAVLPLSVEANWNQTVADWRMMLKEGQGFGLRLPAGRWAASSLVFPLGPALSWISMVLVTASARRCGIGTCLLRHCINYVRSSGKVAGLDATELGRPVYLLLGFRDLYAISRLHLPGERRSAEVAQREPAFQSLDERNAGALASFDLSRSAMHRSHVLAYLMAQAPNEAFALEAEGRLTGYALGRPGRTAFQIGPVVADSGTAALGLIQKMLGRVNGPIMIDVPDVHQDVQEFLRRRGAVRQRGFTRMVSGEPPLLLANPARVFALAGPELG